MAKRPTSIFLERLFDSQNDASDLLERFVRDTLSCKDENLAVTMRSWSHNKTTSSLLEMLACSNLLGRKSMGDLQSPVSHASFDKFSETMSTTAVTK